MFGDICSLSTKIVLQLLLNVTFALALPFRIAPLSCTITTELHGLENWAHCASTLTSPLPLDYCLTGDCELRCEILIVVNLPRNYVTRRRTYTLLKAIFFSTKSDV